MRKFVSSAPHLAYEDIRISLPVIASCIGIAVSFGLVWMLLLRCFSGCMVWATLALIGGGLAFGSWWAYNEQASMKQDALYSVDDAYTHQVDLLYAACFGLAGLTALYLLLLGCVRKKIHIAVGVMKEATRAVAALPLMLMVPLVTLCLVLVVLAYGVVTALLLVSSGELQRGPGRSGFGHLEVDGDTWLLLALHAVGVLWVTWFLRHVQHACVAGAVAQWYFSGDRWVGLGNFPVVGSYCRVLRFHSGSIALGSALITALQAVRFVVLFLSRRLASCKLHNNRLCDLCCCCLNCCLKCVERFVRFLSRNAYVQMMVTGRPFCSSATEALSLLTKNLIKVAVVRSIGWAFLFVGKLFIAAASGGIAAAFLLTQPPYSTELYSITAPVVVVVAGAWLVAIAFMGVYNMTIDTILICFCIDQERVKAGEPPYCSASLAALIQAPEVQEESRLRYKSMEETSTREASFAAMKSEKSARSAKSLPVKEIAPAGLAGMTPRGVLPDNGNPFGNPNNGGNPFGSPVNTPRGQPSMRV
jgi:hypothetical protein